MDGCTALRCFLPSLLASATLKNTTSVPRSFPRSPLPSWLARLHLLSVRPSRSLARSLGFFFLPSPRSHSFVRSLAFLVWSSSRLPPPPDRLRLPVPNNALLGQREAGSPRPPPSIGRPIENHPWDRAANLSIRMLRKRTQRPCRSYNSGHAQKDEVLGWLPFFGTAFGNGRFRGGARADLYSARPSDRPTEGCTITRDARQGAGGGGRQTDRQTCGGGEGGKEIIGRREGCGDGRVLHNSPEHCPIAPESRERRTYYCKHACIPIVLRNCVVRIMRNA